MTVAIVTDSAAALPAELVAKHRITVVPMWLPIGGESVREGERPLSELLGDERVSTSGPAPGEFEQAIESRLGDDGVLVLTIAASMSGTHEAAPDGFLMAYGAQVAKGRALRRASVVDVAPTVLYFLGLPIGRDMDGYARAELFQPSFTADGRHIVYTRDLPDH